MEKTTCRIPSRFSFILLHPKLSGNHLFLPLRRLCVCRVFSIYLTRNRTFSPCRHLGYLVLSVQIKIIVEDLLQN